jgi:hypothetical protein
VRVEGGDDGRAALGLGPADRFAHHGLMTGMEAVEIAQGDDGAAQGFGDGQVGGQAIMESAL